MIKSMKRSVFFIGVLLVFLPASLVFSFTISIPDDVEKMPLELREKWLENEMREGHDLQKKVARERYDRRLEEKKAVARDMVAEAEKRRARIREAREAIEKREQDSSIRIKGAYIGLSIVLVPLIIIAVIYTRSTRVKVPETTGRQSDVLKTSLDLMNKLKKRE